MSALTEAAAERIERELAREREKDMLAYTRHWRLVADTRPERINVLGRRTVRLLHESHARLLLHETLVARFGQEGRPHMSQVARMGELVTYMMSLVADTRDGHEEQAVLDVLGVIAEAME